MKKEIRLKRLKDISISKKLYFIVGTMALLIAMELLTLWFAIHTLSSVRALVGAEGLWSKAQKDAIYELQKYYFTHDENDYKAFQKFMEVPLGDHKTRLELLKKTPDLDIARRGFIEGRVHPDDIDGMIKLLRRFHNNNYIQKAIGYWTVGDSLITQLNPIGEKLRIEIATDSSSKKKLDQLIAELDPLNQKLTAVEDNFSYTLGEGSRWMENLILELLLTVALTVEITGLSLSIYVSRGIAKGLNEINRAAIEIAKGDLNQRATVFSKDEIGLVANAINQMTEQLILSNRELEQFAYIASHDLQEPIRKIIVFTDLFNKECGDMINQEGKVYMEKIISSSLRMQTLVNDILQFSLLNLPAEFISVDLNEIISQLQSDKEYLISKSNTVIQAAPLPVIEANPTQMGQLFQNLISNAIKFNNSDPIIEISSEIISGNQLPDNYWAISKYNFSSFRNTPHFDKEKFCRIYIKDNGIGFEEKYLDKIFIIFQRLHSKQSYQGTGIGLAICKKIVDNHHGIISAKSELGKGATFIITLPLSQKNFSL